MTPLQKGGLLIIAGALVLLKRTGSLPANISGPIDDLSNVLELELGPLLGTGISDDQDVMARTLYGEAGREGRAAMENVAAVIMNRYNLRRKGLGYPSFGPEGATIAQICKAPSQFSCWLDGNKNLWAMNNVTAGDPAFDIALDVAASAIRGQLIDRTGGADHYETFAASNVSTWDDLMPKVFKDAWHQFYKAIK